MAHTYSDENMKEALILIRDKYYDMILELRTTFEGKL